MACRHPQAGWQLRDRHCCTGGGGAARALAPPLGAGPQRRRGPTRSCGNSWPWPSSSWRTSRPHSTTCGRSETPGRRWHRRAYGRCPNSPRHGGRGCARPDEAGGILANPGTAGMRIVRLSPNTRHPAGLTPRRDPDSITQLRRRWIAGLPPTQPVGYRRLAKNAPGTTRHRARLDNRPPPCCAGHAPPTHPLFLFISLPSRREHPQTRPCRIACKIGRDGARRANGERLIGSGTGLQHDAAEPAAGLRPRAVHLHHRPPRQPRARPRFAQDRRSRARVRGRGLGKLARHGPAVRRLRDPFRARALVGVRTAHLPPAAARTAAHRARLHACRSC